MQAKPAPQTLASVPEPMPEPKPEPLAQVPNSYLVFFDWNSAVLSGDAMQVITQTIDNAHRGKVTQIMAVGHADTSGSPVYNDGLSRRRVESVANALVARGIPRNQITVGSKGEAEPLVPTGDGIREPQNRRVVVTFSGR
jgi:OmpA-OmpF porin, OOP family